MVRWVKGSDMTRWIYLAAIALSIGAAAPAPAQTVGYADALGQLGQTCGADIAKTARGSISAAAG